MADEPQNAQENAGDTKEFSFLGTFIRDLSFEAPQASQAIFDTISEPTVGLRLSHSLARVSDISWDVILKINMSAVVDDRTLFMIELDQGGRFVMAGFDDDQLRALITTQCLTALFPFARETIWSIINRAGFPPMLIKPMDLHQLRDYIKSVAGQGNATS